MSWLKRLAHNLRTFFKKPSEGLDSLLRFTDLSVQSLSGEDWFHRRYQIRRHNIDAFLWPSIIAGALIAGMPSLGPRLLAGLAVAVAAFFFFLRAQRWTASKAVGWDLWVQALFVLAVCAVTLTGGRQVPDGFGVYLHLLVPLAGLSALSISAAAWLAPGCFSVLVNGSQYGTFLPKTELFQSFNKRLESGFPATVQAAILVITRPLRLLWPPAIAVMAARRAM